jgi:hypothetical protein
LSEVTEDIHTKANSIKRTQKDGQTNPHTGKCSQSEPPGFVVYKVGYDWRKEPDDDDDNAGNDTTEHTTVANVVHLALDKSPEALLEHPSSFPLDTLKKRRVWMAVVI